MSLFFLHARQAVSKLTVQLKTISTNTPSIIKSDSAHSVPSRQSISPLLLCSTQVMQHNNAEYNQH